MLIFPQGDNWELLINNGLVKKLLAFMNDQDKEIRQQSIKLLSELTQDDEVKELVISSGGIKTIIASLQSDDQTQEAALFSLSSLCNRSTYLLRFFSLLAEDILMEIVKGGVLQQIFAMTTQTVGMQESAIRIVCALTPDGKHLLLEC